MSKITESKPRLSLPKLEVQASQFPSCCCALSTTLLASLQQLLPGPPATVISIGSGSGLLEAFLLESSHKPLDVYGIEVGSCGEASLFGGHESGISSLPSSTNTVTSLSVNVFLPPQRLLLVPTTSSLCSAAEMATAWMFVYPRQTSLIEKYLSHYGSGAVKLIIFIVPVADVEQIDERTMGQFRDWAVDSSCMKESNMGLIEWERLLLYRRGHVPYHASI